ncbi:MAG: hypothetical protein QM762_19170 [Chryseolinea sp.]
MDASKNKGFDQDTIASYRKRIIATGRNYVLDAEDEQSEEYAHFYFIGVYEGRDVIYDAVIYTLRLHHESELFEVAEHRAAQHFPEYKKISYDEDDDGNLQSLDAQEEEIGLFMAEVILELEEEESVKVQEHVDQDVHVEFGISLDVGLHVEHVTPEVISKFVRDFNDDTIRLDENLYSFQTQDQEAE